MTESMTQKGAAETALRLSIEVAVGVRRAFEVFATEFDRIKPREHNFMGEDIAESVLEPRGWWTALRPRRQTARRASGAACSHTSRRIGCSSVGTSRRPGSSRQIPGEPPRSK